MDERKLIKVDVLSIGGWGADFGELPGLLTEWAQWTQELLLDVPEQYRNEVRISFGDDPSPTFRIWYERPETDEEVVYRNDALERTKAEGLDRQRSEYLRLKQLFERD